MTNLLQRNLIYLFILTLILMCTSIAFANERTFKVTPKTPYHYNPPQFGRDVIIVVDPGHGGKDPGATGPHGIHEKNVVLAIGKDIARDINQVPGMKADLTRDGDYFISLRDRLRIARRDHADFFVAIHADAFPNKHAVGASVFALSQGGATSEAARWLAKKENYSELGGVDIANKSRLLRSVLINVSQTATIAESLVIGKDIVKSLGHVTVMHSYHVDQAPFVVLKNPDIPSLLIETGFITNPYEEKRLNSPWYQIKLAKAIEKGIYTYFKMYPPANTYFALEKGAKSYTVKRGDSLSILAEKNRTTIAAIRVLNHLKSNKINIGQTLKIPKNTYYAYKTP